MRTLTKTVRCPSCGRPGLISLSEDIDPVRGTEGHRIEFRCSTNSDHSADEPTLLKLWAADRMLGAS